MLKGLVSVIMPNFNGAEYISDAIHSVQSQTYPNWELLIVDDGSTDNSKEILDTFKNDNRIKVIFNIENKGAVFSRNLAISEAKGEIIAFLDSDDIWYNIKLEKQIEIYNENKNAIIVFSNYEHINSGGAPLNKVISGPSKVDYNTLLKSNCIGCLTATYNCSKIGKRYFKEHGHEDYILWLSILKEGNSAINVEACLAKYRLSKNSLSSDKIKTASWQWKIYRNIENLSLMKSIYYFINYSIKGFIKHK